MQDRRTFLASLAAGVLGAAHRPGAQSTVAAPDQIRKAVLISMLDKIPDLVSYSQRFALAREVGFEGIEMRTISNAEEAAEVREASQKTGLRVHSVMNADHWKFPLSSGDPQVVKQCVAGMETSLRNAALWGADTVLLVPAVVDATTSYRQAWERSQHVIRERLIGLAQELKVVIAVEEVWNKFLLSPLEFARYVDELDSPWVKAYFDVGNVVLYGYPQDWIRALGKRIVRLHIKDFRFKDRMAEFVPLREGEINWKAVHQAIADIGYKGIATVEVRGGEKDAIAEISRRLDLILEGA
jgi:hexulose-6-phosphate isomerase